MPNFDPYHKWLGISPKDQPPNHYRLLGIDLFESDPDVISAAADQRMVHVRSFQSGKNSDLSQRVLNEIAAARVCLLSPEKKAEYDAMLRALSDGHKKSPPTPASVLPPALTKAASPRDSTKTLSDFNFTPMPVGTKRKASKGARRPLAWVAFGLLAVAVVAVILIGASMRQQDDSKNVAQDTGELLPQKAKSDESPQEQQKTRKSAKPRATPKPPKEMPEPNESIQLPSKKTPEPKSEPKRQDPTLQPPTPDPPRPETPGGKLPVPDNAAQQAALAIIRETYKDDYKASDKTAFLKTLLQTAEASKSDTVARFVLLQETRDVAAEAGHGEIAFQAIDAMAGEYDINASETKADVLEKGAKLARTLFQRKAIAQAALDLMNETLKEDAFATAKQMGKLAVTLARQAKDGGLVQEIVAKNKEIAAAEKKHADVEEAMATLKTIPADPAANLVVGKYRCSKGDWVNGLPMLAVGNDATLKALAERDLNGATTTEEQVKLGDAWWSGGGKQRAVHWYETALPQLAGLEKDRVEGRIAAVEGANRNTKWFLVFRSADPRILESAQTSQKWYRLRRASLDGARSYRLSEAKLWQGMCSCFYHKRCSWEHSRR